MSKVYKTHVIQYGETLQSITQKYLGDISVWKDVADFNNLQYPYLVETIEEKNSNPEKWRTIGDTIIIELPANANSFDALSPTFNEADKERIYSLALGSDLSLVGHDEDELMFSEDRTPTLASRDNVVYLTDNNRGDVETVSGMYNLRQALLVRLMTEKGSYVGHPSFGSNISKYIGWKSSMEAQSLITLEIERTLKEDGRVADVEVKNTSLIEGVYNGHFIITPIRLEESFNFIMSIPNDQPIILLES